MLRMRFDILQKRVRTYNYRSLRPADELNAKTIFTGLTCRRHARTSNNDAYDNTLRFDYSAVHVIAPILIDN